MGYDYQTSLEAWLDVQEKLPRCRKIVLITLWHMGNATNMEIAKHLNWSINRVTPRVKELREMGLVEQAEIRKCGVTNNSARAWKLTIKGVNMIRRGINV